MSYPFLISRCAPITPCNATAQTSRNITLTIRTELWIPFSQSRSASRLLLSELTGKRRRRARALRSRRLVFRGGRLWLGGRLWARRRRLLRAVDEDEVFACARRQRRDVKTTGVVLGESRESGFTGQRRARPGPGGHGVWVLDD